MHLISADAAEPVSPVRRDIKSRIDQNPKARCDFFKRDVFFDFGAKANERVFLAIVDPSRRIACAAVIFLNSALKSSPR